jgi:hypothetical protein
MEYVLLTALKAMFLATSYYEIYISQMGHERELFYIIGGVMHKFMLEIVIEAARQFTQKDFQNDVGRNTVRKQFIEFVTGFEQTTRSLLLEDVFC